MATETTTPSIQDILSDYQTSVGAGGVSTDLLLQALRNRQTMAEQEDAATAKNLQSLGKAGLSTYKFRRDFLLAKRANPDLTVSDFLADPRTGAKYMKEASDMIARGDAKKIGLAETFGLKGIKAPSFKSKTDGSKPMGTRIEKEYVEKEIPKGTRINKKYVEKEIPKGTPIDPLLAKQESGVAVGRAPKGIDVISFEKGATQEQLDAAMQAAKERIGTTTQVPNVGGSAMKALGLAGSLYGLGTGIRDIKKGKGDLSTVAGTVAGGLGTLSSLGVLGAVNPLVGLGLGGLSMLGKRR
jgi:hypothetical protein